MTRVLPGRRLLKLAAAWTLGGVAAAMLPVLEAPVAWAGAALALAALADLALAWRTQVPAVRRDTGAVHPLDRWRVVRLELVARSRRSLHLQVYDHHPACADSEGLPAQLVLPGDGKAEVRYRVRFSERGEFSFAGVEVRLAGPWQLAEVQRLLPPSTPVRVYPDFAAVARFALMAADHHLSRIGIRRRRRRGEGLEFHQLREYRRGDALRQIDWKATSRQRKLISREYQDERDQQLLFLLDCGSRMYSRDGARSHFDQALDALLLLAHVAVNQGDAVGGLSFAGSERLLAPRKGKPALGRLMERLYDLQPGLDAPDYRAAAQRLQGLTTKRSLVLLITNLRDEDGEELLAAVQLLRRRHMVLVASLRETVVDELLAAPQDSFESSLGAAGARLYADARGTALARLQQHGAHLLDVAPRALPVALVNRYLEIKRSGQL